MHTRLVVRTAGVLVVAALVGVVGWRLLAAPSTYDRAMSSLPQDVLRATYTDWAQVRAAAKGDGLGAGASKAEVSAFTDRAYDLDLTSGSALAESVHALQQHYGFSPLHAQWEAFGQGKQGQVDVLRVDDGVDLAGVERTLRRLGYDTPSAGSGQGGTWTGGADLVAQLDPDLTPVQQNVVVVPDQHLVLMSDNAGYLSSAAHVVTASGDALTDEAGVDGLVEDADEPVTALLWSRGFACEDLSMGQADDEDQRVGDQLVRKAGGITPLDGFVMAQQADRSLVLGLHFETEERAKRNLQPRVDLASGDAPGQGGSFRDRFTVASGERDGRDVVVRTRPTDPDEAVFSDLSSGPLLLATC